MSSGRRSARELVGDTFSPRIAILSSPAAQALCEKNGLNFTQLIHPFTTLTNPYSWLEPTGAQIFPKCLKLSPVDIASWKPAVQDAQRNRQIQHGIVSQSVPPLRLDSGSEIRNGDSKDLKFKAYKMRGKGCGTSEYTVEVPESTPWFESWRETCLKLYSEQNSGQYEFFGHFIACILVISTTEGRTSEELTTMVGKLSKLQQQHQTEWPQTWLLSSVLKFYILLHDSSTEDDGTGGEGVYQNLRTTFGGNFCYMIKLNTVNNEELSTNSDPWNSFISQDKQLETALNSSDEVDSSSSEPFRFTDMPHPLSPDEESPSFLSLNGVKPVRKPGDSLNPDKKSSPRRNISAEDVLSIQTSINEFIGKALLPYIERQCRMLHESIVNRRSMSKSFFGATKRLFGASAKAPLLTVYTQDSPEAISRKLADLYFLFGHYSGAYHLYHQLKKDFHGDQAWIYYAASLEMAAISHFMMTQTELPAASSRSFPVHYVSEAVKYYMEHTRMIDAAIRCTIVCCECLRELDNFPMAAEIYIRMTSEECDLRSALMLEQAAYAFLHMNSARKFALHSILAGHRFGKAGLKVHSLNSYTQASQVYNNRGWRFAEDHVHFTISRHLSFLQIQTGLAKYLKSLLRCPSPQPVGQIQLFYKEMLTTMAKLYDEERVPHVLDIPRVVYSEIRIRIGSTGLQTGELHNSVFNETTLSTYWDTLEEQIVREKINTSVTRFKPSRMLFQQGTDNTVQPAVPYNEYFYIEIPFQNRLPIEISLQNIGLEFDPGTSISSTVVSELCFQPEETKLVRFAVSSSREGKVKFEWIFYELSLGTLTVPFKQKVVLKGPRLNTSKAERYGRIYAKDLRNEFRVTDQMPLLQAELDGLPSSLYHTQRTKFNIVLRDKSMDPMEKKRICRVIFASENLSEFLQVVPDKALNDLVVLEDSQRNYCPVALTLDGSSTIKIPCLYNAPQTGESTCVNLLVLYEIKKREPQENRPSSLYRVIKLSIKVPLQPCLKLEYFNLKALDTVSSLNLLNLQNLTKAGSVEIEDLSFAPGDDQSIEELNYSPAQNFLNSKITIRATDSMNILAKTKRKSKSPEPGLLFLILKWNFILPDDGHNSNNSDICGTYKLQVRSQLIGCSSVEKKAEEYPLVYEVIHKAKNTHDFNNYPCYVCPVELLIHPRRTGKVKLTISKASELESETISTAVGTKASSQDVYLIGQTRWLLTFSEAETKSISYKVAVTRPGIFNVAPTISIKWMNTDFEKGDIPNAEESQFPTHTLHSPVIVAQSLFLTDVIAF